MATEKREITSELQESYLSYAMSVIVSRALPDVRDGLKPVQRRILWAMWETGLKAGTKLRKSAAVVGEVMKSYHPHGDSSIYDAITRMVQDFSLRYPLIEGQGNWGSIDGDNAAAMRYCVTGDTLVVTEKGLLPIEKISENGGEDMEIKILSKDRIINQATKWFDSGEHPTIKIKTRNGFSLQGTHNHPILTWTKNPASGEPTFKWKLLGDLRDGDVAVIDRTSDVLWPEKNLSLQEYTPHPKNPRVEKKILPKEFDEDLAFILGALVSEGTIKERELEFCNSDTVFIEEFKARWQSVFPDCRLHHFRRKPNSFGKKPYETLEIHSQYIIEFLRKMGLTPGKSRTKRIPFIIFQSPEPVAASFLRAYFEGDGSISWSSKMTELSAISVSEELIRDIQTILLRFGIVVTKRFDRYRNTHKLYVRSLKNYILFQNKIGFISERKKRKLEEAVARLHKDYSQNDFVPFIGNFARANVFGKSGEYSFVTRNNFDRYASMQKNYERVVSTVQTDVRPLMNSILKNILEQNYLFDPVMKIENAGIQRVYSIRVDSNCHSFVANGFINHNTECRLSKISEEMLADIEKETVDWQPNYDASTKEPKVLPAKLPDLLLNGTVGIAVGMATNIPPHNLTEVADAILHFAENPDADTNDLLKFIKGPDFPTGGIIFDQKAIRETYVSGRGPILTRAKADIQERKNRQFDIVITEIPYQVNKSELIKHMAELVQNKKIEGIRDIRDESDREGLRIVIELKTDANPQKILNQLYQYTALQKYFHMNMIALADGIQPQLMTLKDVISAYFEHRKKIVRRRTEFELKKARERAHILEGLAKALGVIDKIIATIKKSKDRNEAHQNLVKQFKLSDIQATAILEMKLQSLAALERKKIDEELKEKLALIKELELILKSAAKIVGIITNEVKELKEKYGGARKTAVVSGGIKTFSEEDLVPEEEAVVTLSAGGYIKRLPPDAFKTQKRGGKGLIGSDVSEEDLITQFFGARTHDNILFFTDRGRVFQTKVYEIPAASRTSKGRAIHNFLELPSEEKVSAVISYADKRGLGAQINADTKEKNLRESASHLRESAFLIMVTKNGIIKKTPLKDFENIRRTGIIAISLKKGDALKWVRLSSGSDQIVLGTKNGQAIRFKETQARPMSRTAAGIRAIRLKKSDEVAGFDIITSYADKRGLGTQINADTKEKNLRESASHLRESAFVLVVMANGFGKQTPLKEYKLQNRGGSGIKTANITAKTGQLVAAQIITEQTELLALSEKGQIIRTNLSGVRMTGRSAQGVRIMNLKPGDKIAGIVVI